VIYVKAKRPQGFFSSPFDFSFKDLIAAVFVGAFLYITYRALSDKQALEVMKSWVSLIMVVLTGYFGQEAVSAYFMSKNPQPNPYGYNSYGGYGTYGGYGGYSYTQPTMQQDNTDPSESQE
jgi:hypothetical protein